METVFKLKATELDKSFIDSVKNLFKDSEIEISIRLALDETEYLMSSSENKKYLLKAIKDLKTNKNLVRFSGDEFEEYTEKLFHE